MLWVIIAVVIYYMYSEKKTLVVSKKGIYFEDNKDG
jgi:hypothetical protein